MKQNQNQNQRRNNNNNQNRNRNNNNNNNNQNRNRNNNNNNGRGGSQSHNQRNHSQRATGAVSANRQYDSHGPVGKLRGTVKQLYEKYTEFANEARRSDPVERLALLQYADHYFRLYSEISTREAEAVASREAERVRRQQEAAERRANAAENTDFAPAGDPISQTQDAQAAPQKEQVSVQEEKSKPAPKPELKKPELKEAVQSSPVTENSTPEAAQESPAAEEKPKAVRKPRKPRVKKVDEDGTVEKKPRKKRVVKKVEKPAEEESA